MEKFHNAIGIDFSEDKLDVFNYLSGHSQTFDNTPSGHKKFLEWFNKTEERYPGGQLICFEHTGVCTLNFMNFIEDKGLKYAVRSGYEIKHSWALREIRTTQ